MVPSRNRVVVGVLICLFLLSFQGKSIHSLRYYKETRMGSKFEDMKMEDFIKIEKIGEGNKRSYNYPYFIFK